MLHVIWNATLTIAFIFYSVIAKKLFGLKKLPSDLVIPTTLFVINKFLDRGG